VRKLKDKKEHGFTLVEIMVSVSIFLIIVTISMGAILGVFSANRKARSQKTIMNNLNLSLEAMSREMRFGSKYHCGSGPITTTQDCNSGDTSVSFLSQDGKQITYKLNGTSIEKSVDSSGLIPVTSSDVSILNLKFYVIGSTFGDTMQPKVIIVVKGYAGTKSRSDFSLETMVSQRQIDR
jgi:prepilin-type N-terminal cleavage/methylation domain-containing protein